MFGCGFRYHVPGERVGGVEVAAAERGGGCLVGSGGPAHTEVDAAWCDRGEHAEGQKLTRPNVDPAARYPVLEAIRREEALDVLLVCRRGGVQLLHNVGADDLPLHVEALRQTVFWSRSGLRR